MQLHTLKHARRVNGLGGPGTISQSYLNQNAEGNLNNPEILIGVSSELLFKEDGRLDKQHNNTDNTIIQLLGEHFVLRSFSPEAEIDLGIVKQAVQLQNQDGGIRSDGLSADLVDKTNCINPLSIQQNDLHSRLSGYVIKQNFSTDANANKTLNDRNIMDIDNAVYAANFYLDSPLFPVIGNRQLADPVLNENFIQCVCVMHRWQQLANQDATIYPLIRFHQQHHHLYLSHDPDKAAEIEAILALKDTLDIDELYTLYIQAVMEALISTPLRKNHVSVMRKLLSVIEPYLSREYQQEIAQSIEHYQFQKNSIKVPLTLLRYHIGIHALPEVSNSTYLFPYPQERMLCLQNEVVEEIEFPTAS